MSTLAILILVTLFVYAAVTADREAAGYDAQCRAEHTRSYYTVELLRARRVRAKALADCVYWSDRLQSAYGVQFDVVMTEREAACTRYAVANAAVQALVNDACSEFVLIK